MAYRLHGNRTQGLRSMRLVLEMIDTYQALALTLTLTLTL